MAPLLPRVTVLMPVHNGARFLPEAVDSILAQSFREFELLVIDDGSTDDSAAIVSSYSDPRIRLFHNEKNLGLIATLNRGLDLSRGEYVARMDCDDVSHPERLARQVAFMDSHPDIGVCGVWYREFGCGSAATMRLAPDHDSIRCGTLFNPVVGHPGVLLRRSVFESHALSYDPTFPHAEDYELWSRAMRCCRFANIAEVLLYYRVHPGQVSRALAGEQLDSAGRVRLKLLEELALRPGEEEFQIHQMLSALTRPLRLPYQDLPTAYQLDGIDSWLCRLKGANDRSGVYPEPHFSRMLVERWVGVCVLNYLSRGHCSPRIFTPRLFTLIERARRVAASFTVRRIGWVLSDLLPARRKGERCGRSATP